MILTEILIPFIFFATVFGIAYLYFTGRNRERLAMIERGMDPKSQKKETTLSFSFTMLLMNLGLLGIGIGVALLIGNALEMIGLDRDIAYPACILLCGGIALFIGFNKTMSLMKKTKSEEE